MYNAKQTPGNAVRFYEEQMDREVHERFALVANVRDAARAGEFILEYQPQIDVMRERLVGAEALLRWQHPERGTVSPVEFIPVLEETGLILPVGEWVLRRACEDLTAWQAAGILPGPVSVNLSARQFRLPDLDARLKAIVAAAGVAPSLVELEITESQLVQDPDHAIRMMRSLCDAGMRIAIDDFGTGYSSLSYLTRFPVGALKIDRSFVRDLIEDASDATIVRTIIEMAHTLGFTVVAEGIETEAQANYLREHRCEEGQGFLFARPMPAGELAAFLASAAARPRKLARKK
jgi:EAL domain-containing protein (putative c-di-GMP-specific phosphodiesterase class I)